MKREFKIYLVFRGKKEKGGPYFPCAWYPTYKEAKAYRDEIWKNEGVYTFVRFCIRGGDHKKLIEEMGLKPYSKY